MKYRHAIFIVLLVIFIDQALKIYIKTHFSAAYDVNEVKVIGSWFRLHFLENDGMAFGMKLSAERTGKLILTLFRLVAVIFGFFVLKHLVNKKYSTGVIICGALILAGALGNLLDCMFYGMIFTASPIHQPIVATFTEFGKGYGSFMHGKVVDMLYFPLVDTKLPDWVPFVGGNNFEFFEPVFNIADAAISTGVLVLLFFQKRLLHKKPDTTTVTDTIAEPAAE